MVWDCSIEGKNRMPLSVSLKYVNSLFNPTSEKSTSGILC